MDLFLPVKLEELKSLSDKEVVERINAKIVPDTDTPTQFSFPDFVSAQFYMAELDRREKQRAEAERDRIEKRRWYVDFALESLIVVLIFVEIGLSISDHRQNANVASAELKTFSDIQGVLSNLQASTGATAALLGQELDLEYALAVNVEYNGFDTIQVFNNSRSEAFIAGIRIDGVLTKIKQGRPTVIADHNMMPIRLIDYSPHLQEKAAATIGKLLTFPVEIYLYNAREKEFVWKGHFTWGNSAGIMIGSPAGQLVAEPWNNDIKKVLQVHSSNP
jgi:hypothetical protein